jgi:hypothetical protein
MVGKPVYIMKQSHAYSFHVYDFVDLTDFVAALSSYLR